jgi:hypothetical protein
MNTKKLLPLYSGLFHAYRGHYDLFFNAPPNKWKSLLYRGSKQRKNFLVIMHPSNTGNFWEGFM